jgi:hypothetical protein
MEIIGHIAVVQESRFRLTTPTGQSFLLTLHHAANVDADDLRRYQQDRCQVTVHYSGDPGLASGVVRSVKNRS